MLIKYLNLIKCIAIILVCKENLEYQIEDDWLEIYDGLRHRKEEINENFIDSHAKRKMICRKKPVDEKNIKVLKIVTNFNIETIRIFINIITTENIPNSKNVDLDEILKIFLFLGINDKFYC
ncbi:hypothetical protein DMUE_4186, partial [Dictyocoela muelleri]